MVNQIKLALNNNSYNSIVNYLLTFYVCFAGLFTILVLVFELDRHLTGNWSADVIFTYLLILAVINCLCNPLIYAFKLNIVRRQFRSSLLFRCFESCRRVLGRFQQDLLIIFDVSFVFCQRRRFICMIAEVGKDLTHLHSYHVHRYKWIMLFARLFQRIWILYLHVPFFIALPCISL